jgi:hypothetical protein
MRTSWRRPPHEQAGIVSVRLGTLLLVTSPHAWQTSSAMATMSGWIPELASSHPINSPTRWLKPKPRSRGTAGVGDVAGERGGRAGGLAPGPASSCTALGRPSCVLVVRHWFTQEIPAICDCAGQEIRKLRISRSALGCRSPAQNVVIRRSKAVQARPPCPNPQYRFRAGPRHATFPRVVVRG